MNHTKTIQSSLIVATVLTMMSSFDSQLSIAHAQGTAFTYQGRLNNNGAVANGSYDVKFTLYATNVTGIAMAGPVTNMAVTVTNGLFTTFVAFGSGVFTGGSNWLEIAVSTNAANAFSTLAPRQQLTPVPYAVTSENVSGAVSASQLAGGTVSTNVLPGFQGPFYAAVGGGQANAANNTYGAVGGGFGNTAGYLAVVGGGDDNTASGFYATVPGGANNVAGGQYSLAAGQRAKALHQGAFVWADSQAADFASTTNDQFIIRAQNGVGIGTNGTAANALTVAGNVAAAAFSGSGAGLSNLNASSLTGSILPGNIGAGTITGASLAPGAAAANLAAGNQTAVPSGGVIMTVSGGYQEPNLLNVGYVKIGSLTLIPESWNANANLQAGPPDTGELTAGRVGHSAVWTGTEMIVWGGADGEYADTLYNNGASYNPTANTWTVINANSGLAPRNYQAAVWTGSAMLIWGGAGNPVVNNGDNSEFNNGASYNPTTDSWTPMSTVNAPTGRDQASAVWTGTKMIVWGGYYGLYNSSTFELVDYYPTNGAIYDPVANTWTAMNHTGAPVYTVGNSAVWTGTSMIIYGGYPPSGGFSTSFGGGSYNPANNTWSAISSNSFAGTRYNHSAIWDGTNMIVWGGISAVTEAATNTGASYNPVANTWTPISGVGAPAARELHTAVWTGTQMIIWGGDDANLGSPGFGVYSDGASYSPAANTWTALSTNSVPLARSSHSALWTGSSMIIWGGDAVIGFDSADDPLYQEIEPGGIYYPAYNLWEGMSYRPGSGEPGARENATAVWTGSEMLVWGGDNSGFLLQSGGNFNLAANTWSPITTSNAPSVRQNYTALWTGNSMVVWGGQNEGSTLSTGGRYYPASGTWAATTITNAPVSRASHVAVWDGTEMLVWGGYETALLSPAAGGRYNPLTDAWVPMNTTNEPAVASGAAAVWTGTNMIVWGGIVGNVLASNFVASGGIYVPALDSWTALPTNNAPSPRAGHSALWTGTDCLVYGGYNASTNLNTGARFTLASNSWTALSLSNAPPALTGDVIVWSGTKMLVYGGTYLLGGFPTYDPFVGIYNPAQDLWSYSMEGPVEAALVNACGVWADSGFLVWGGYSADSGLYSNQPYLYTPQLVMDLLLRP